MKVGEFGDTQPGLFGDVETIDTKGCARFRNEHVGWLRQREPTQPEFHRDLERRSRAHVDLVAGIGERLARLRGKLWGFPTTQRNGQVSSRTTTPISSAPRRHR